MKSVRQEGYLILDEKRKRGLVKRIQNQITKFGLTNEEISFTNTCLTIGFKTLIRIRHNNLIWIIESLNRPK